MEALRLDEEQYSPGGQKVQSLSEGSFSLSPYVPLGQGVGEDHPTWQYDPWGQGPPVTDRDGEGEEDFNTQ